MKKKLLAISLVVLLVAAAAVGTQAAIGARFTADSVITTGGVTVTLVETFDAALGNPAADAITVNPGQTSGLRVAARNDGANPIYVRVRATATITDSVTGAALPATTVDAAGNTVNCVELTYAPAGWLQQDGWYYYTQILQPGQTTPELITAIGFSAAIGAGYEKGRVNLALETDGLQSENNPIGAGETVLDVAGWPA